jgi:hypothetical protein
MLLSEIKDLSKPITTVELLEMANIHPDDSGLDYGTIFYSTSYGQHGCRIKYCPIASQQSKTIIITVPGFEIVKDTLGTTISNDFRKQILLFAMRNDKRILKFWYHGLELTGKEQWKFYQSFRKLTNADKKASKKLELRYNLNEDYHQEFLDLLEYI